MISCSASSNVTQKHTASATDTNIVIPSVTRDLALDCLDCFVRDSVKTAILDSVVTDYHHHGERNRTIGRLEGAAAVSAIVIFIKLIR